MWIREIAYRRGIEVSQALIGEDVAYNKFHWNWAKLIISIKNIYSMISSSRALAMVHLACWFNYL